MDERARHYRRDGFLIGSWARTRTLERLTALCRDSFEGRIKEGYKAWVHFDGQGSDVPLDHKYDPVLLDILFENGVTQLLEQCIGPNAVLFRLNAITSLPPGYMSDWHSDGFIRPVHKLFFYPKFGDQDSCLEVLPGSYEAALGLSQSHSFQQIRYTNRECALKEENDSKFF